MLKEQRTVAQLIQSIKLTSIYIEQIKLFITSTVFYKVVLYAPRTSSTPIFSISFCVSWELKYSLESPPLFADNSLFLGEGSFRLLEGFGADAIILPFRTKRRLNRLTFRYQGTVKIKRVALLSAYYVYKELEYLS